MGHLCNYAKREDGKVTLYYSHWGALTVARDFFWGKEAALSFLDAHDPSDEKWVDDVFGEGGAAVDLDGRVLTLSGGEIYGPARTLLVELASVIWARDGFVVRDVDSIADVAEAVGVDRNEVEAEHLFGEALDPKNDALTARADAQFRAVVVKDGVARFVGDARSVLELGEARVSLVDELPDLVEAKALWEERAAPEWEKPKRPLAERVHQAIVIDTRARRLEVSDPLIRNGKSRRHFAAKWAGWEIIERDPRAMRDALGIRELVLPPAIEPPLDELIAEVEAYLFDGRRGDLGAWFAEWTKTADPGSWINPRAVVPTRDGRPTDPASANEMLRSALAEVAARRRTKVS
jgi:hypothetical protein